MGDGKILVGGTLPDAPNITLNAAGSGIFNSTLTTKAQVIAVSDDAYMLTSSRSGNNLPSYFAAKVTILMVMPLLSVLVLRVVLLVAIYF